MTLGEKIAKHRKEYNYTQEQLADLLDVSRQSISKWESDAAYPETDKLLLLGKIFDCSMDYLLVDEMTDKQNASSPAFVDAMIKKWMTIQNKETAKKTVKLIGIVLAIVFMVDAVSMILYFLFFGMPH